MRTGTVISYNIERGFGFIKLSDEFKYVWFHVHKCLVEPKKHLAVQFEVIDSPKGPVAVGINSLGAITGAADSLSGGAR